MRCLTESGLWHSGHSPKQRGAPIHEPDPQSTNLHKTTVLTKYFPWALKPILLARGFTIRRKGSTRTLAPEGHP
eukprot:4334312-Pyramimonas_sp.AAC.1